MSVAIGPHRGALAIVREGVLPARPGVALDLAIEGRILLNARMLPGRLRRGCLRQSRCSDHDRERHRGKERLHAVLQIPCSRPPAVCETCAALATHNVLSTA